MRYKGFVIEAHPNPLHDGQWDTSLTIHKSIGNSDYEWPRCGEAVCASREEAVQQAISYGQRIIDAAA